MIRRRLLLPLGLVLGGLMTTFLVVAYYYHTDRQQEIVSSAFHEIRDMFDLELERNTSTLSAVIGALNDNPELAEAYQAGDRERLLSLSGPLFERLHAKLDLTHFYYIQPDRTVFLRVHQPARHGDVIDRATLREAVARREVFAGLELGPIGTFTLRVVAPWRRNGELIGYLELGREIDGVVATVGRLHHAHLLMMISKDAIDRSRWEGAMAFLGRHAAWETLQHHAVISELPADLGHEVGFLETAEDGSEARVGSHYFRVFRAPVPDVGGAAVAELAMVLDVTDWHTAFRRYGLVVVVAAVGLGGGLMVLFFRLGVGVEASLAQYESNLRREHDRVRRQAISLARFADQLAGANERAELARAAAEAAGLSKSRFLSTISHELHTPLNAVIGFSELLESELAGMGAPERLCTYVGHIVVNGRQLLGMVDDMITFADADGHGDCRPAARFDVSELIKEACLRVDLQAQERGVVVEEAIRDVALMAWGDPVSFQQGIFRLLAHAVQVTPAGGRVKVSASGWEQGPLEIVVEDQGPGMAQDRCLSALRPFDPLDVDHRGCEGLELTLALVHRLITAYGGVMNVSIGEEGGNLVRLILPAPPAGPVPGDSGAIG